MPRRPTPRLCPPPPTAHDVAAYPRRTHFGARGLGITGEGPSMLTDADGPSPAPFQPRPLAQYLARGPLAGGDGAVHRAPVVKGRLGGGPMDAAHRRTQRIPARHDRARSEVRRRPTTIPGRFRPIELDEVDRRQRLGTEGGGEL